MLGEAKEDGGTGGVEPRYGRRRVVKMIHQINKLRAAIAAEGTPAIQSAWDDVESHIDYAYRADVKWKD